MTRTSGGLIMKVLVTVFLAAFVVFLRLAWLAPAIEEGGVSGDTRHEDNADNRADAEPLPLDLGAAS